MTKYSPFRYFKTSPEITRLAMMLSPLWLTIPAISTTRPHACAALQTCLFWHAVTQLFAGWCHSCPLKAQHRLGLGLGWL
ncbi:hypothetical protein OAT86_00600 [Planktomarina sp.]|nr:hypothetical protein [Planktomarina sp.]